MSFAPPRPALARRRQCLVAGVAGGLADHLGWSATAVRVAFVGSTFFAGAGLVFYVLLWAFTPWSEASGRAPVERRLPVAILLTITAMVAALIALAASASAASSVASARLAPPESEIERMPLWATAAIVAAMLAGAAGAWVTFIDRRDPERGHQHERAVHAVLTVTLLVVAIVIATGAPATASPSAATIAAIAALGGIALVFAPSVVRLGRDLTDERVRRVRDEQRSEIAAHLHDSVLQTLALIQNRSGASSEAGRLARAQERELRSWLFAGDALADSDLGSDLRDYAGALEIDYPVRIDVVVVGTSTERASGELAAAAREAMLNAARHAGGEVSVYIEGTTDTVDVFVRDRGPGFDPSAVPSDRLGVRESVIGRMRRAGGSATVGAGAGGIGTEVHLRYEEKGDRG